jgi:hypothetical protein
MSHSIFISYDEADVFMMRRLRHDFGQYQFVVWSSDEANSILQTECLVVLLSPSAAYSTNVQAEIHTARTMRKPIFPVLVSGEDEEVAPLGFRPHQWIDLRFLGEYEHNLNKLLVRVAQELDIPQEVLPTLDTAPPELSSYRPTMQSSPNAILHIPPTIYPSQNPATAPQNPSLPWPWIIGAAAILIGMILVVLLVS